jgi:hypothetical protein
MPLPITDLTLDWERSSGRSRRSISRAAGCARPVRGSTSDEVSHATAGTGRYALSTATDPQLHVLLRQYLHHKQLLTCAGLSGPPYGAAFFA